MASSKFDQPLIAFGDGGAELVAVDVEIVKQALEVVLAVRTDGRAFYSLEYACQGFVQIDVVAGLFAHGGKQLRGQDVEAFFLDGLGAALFGVSVG